MNIDIDKKFYAVAKPQDKKIFLSLCREREKAFILSIKAFEIVGEKLKKLDGEIIGGKSIKISVGDNFFVFYRKK